MLGNLWGENGETRGKRQEGRDKREETRGKRQEGRRRDGAEYLSFGDEH